MGGGGTAYRLSKAALNALTRTLAADEPELKVNAICPGWVRTDMGGSSAPRSVEQGADTAVWLATMPAGGPSGGFFRDREPIPW
jgi:NAD(P)-dependent dehydrogenase (short-subunit alcohol dehydrogenase family)